MKSKRLLLLLLLAIGLPWAANAQQTVTATCYPPTETYATGYTDGTDKTSGQLHVQSAGGDRGWMKFDVSAIPDGATINSITLNFYCIEGSNPYVNLTAAGELDPATASASDLFTAIAVQSPNYYTSTYISGLGSSAWKTFNLSSSAVSNLQSNGLTNDYFTVGFYAYETYSYYFNAYGYDNADYKPYIEVTYASTEPYVELSPATAKIQPGATETLTATPGNITGTPTYSYSSSNTSVATVSGSGTTATVTGVAVGTATITVTMNYEGANYTATSEITVSNEITVPIGSGTSTFYYLPTHTNYKYSYSQQIYTAAEIGEPGTITSVSFKGASARTRTLDVYMVNTDKASFSSTSDFIAVSEADRVFSGSVSFVANDWTTITLTGVGFDYTGENLAIIVDDNTGSDPGITSWSTFTASSDQGLYYYQDASNINPSSPTSASYKYCTTSKNQIILSIIHSSTPKPRNLVVSDITSETATVTWTAPADNVTGYQYQYKYATTPTWPDTWNSLDANVTHKDLVALAANTLYDFRVRANYAEGDSDPAETQFTTEATCLPVTNITVSDITTTGAKLAWTPGGSETSWQYLTLAHGATPDWTSQLVITSNTHANVPANIYACTGVQPQPNTEYDFYVRANCGGGDYSEAAMLTFRTACGAISSFPINYGFETSEGFPANASAPTTNQLGTCWRNEATVQNGTYADRVWGTSTSYKHNGSQALVLPDKGNSPNFAKTMLVFPEMEFTNPDGYSVSFWIYRSGSSSNPEGFKLYVSDCDTIGPNAVELGHYSRNYSIAYPDIVSTGWYQYETAPITRTGSVYLIFEGQSYYGSATYVDDIVIKEAVVVTANQIVNTVSNPATEMTWNEFVSHWNNGDHFTSSTFTLMDNITVSTMVGTSDKPFTGTFDGNSHTITVNLTATDANFTAPFRVIRNATIQNLKVDGTINDGGFKFCAGFSGDCYGNNIFTNCVSDVTINATTEGDGTHGGFIARNYGGGGTGNNLCTTVFNGCAFTGQLLGANTNQVGGFCGWSEYYSPNYAKTIFNSCLFAPQAVTMSTTSSAAFARRRDANYVNFNNCYFMQDFNDGTNNTAQGKQAYTITGVSPVEVAFSGEHTLYNMSGIDAYTEGMIHGYTKLAGEGDVVTLTLSGAPGYEANHGTLEASGANYTLLMEAYNTEISGVDCPVPFNVEANDVTATSAKIAWEGNSDTYKLMYRNVITAAVDFDETYDFEDGTQGWTTIDADGHGDAWSRNTSGGYGSNNCMRAKYNSTYAHQDYLVSPQITLGGSLSFYAKQESTSYSDSFRVYLSTSGNSASDFTIELTDGNVTPTTTYAPYTYDLSGYSGMGYVAIVYTAAANQYYLYIDDIKITATIAGEYGEWETVNEAVNPQPISSLTPETTYQVKVSGFCNGVETDESPVVEFTTLATCPAPTALAVTEGSVTAHEATITWTENGEATTWIVEYADNADFTNALTETMEDNATYSFDELDGETTYYVRVKAHCGDEDESDYSNVVNFTTLVACQAPTVLTVTEGSVTTNQVELSWTENGTATAWQICLNGDETNLIAANSNPFTLESLTAATSYTVKVRANCGVIDGESAWSNEVSFTTDCGVIALPYTYGFEDSNGPACWTMTNCLSSTGVNTSAKHTGTYGFRFYYVANSEQYLISPEFESTTAQVAVSFYYMNYSSNYDETFHVGYSTTTNDVAAFTWGDEITADENDWVLYSDVFPAGTKYVALKHTSDDAFYLYVDDFSFQPVFTKTIAAVGNENWEDGKGGYYLIASPLAEDVTPNADNGFIVGDYDLYMFDQAEENEWVNYKDNENGGGFSIVNGTGYLYASKEGTTLTFTGAPYSGTIKEVPLSVAENTDNLGAVNLVGNPFAVDAYITKSFYTLENSDTYTPNEAGTTIQAMQGLLVVADEDGEILTFTTTRPGNKSAKLNMNVTKGRAVVDRAIVSFNEGQQLPKLQFRNGSTKVYIPQDGKDYAIVSAESMGTMPVNFKAENNGTYTLSFTAEEVSFAYLHLIDNMTGIETDLLANPSYSFDAKTTDYESRFKLVFATGNNANDDAFAFYSNGSFIINNEGEATLQVIDMNGRILKSESINGCANVNVKAAAGVYMLRLVNGNDVKVQKVVVR